MTEVGPVTRFRGLPVSAGRAAGLLWGASETDNSDKDGKAAVPLDATPEDVTAAFAQVTTERAALAARLRAAGRDEEAGIIEIAALIAADPALSAPAADAVRGGAKPAAAIRDVAEQQASLMEKLDNPALAARASDIRQVAEAALDFLVTVRGNTLASPEPAVASGAAAGPGEPFILVRREVSPAELIELADRSDGTGDGTVLAGAVSVAGGASSHAAIIARGLGLPMIAAADPAVLTLPSGRPAVLDADAGELIVPADPMAKTAIVSGPQGSNISRGDDPPYPPDVASGDEAAPTATLGSAPASPAGPARTVDGVEVTVLCNVASAAETRRGLATGAAGVGLLRTEIPFIDAQDWPGYDRQRAHLAPILAQLAGRTAIVRLLDFSGDKIPPFLDGGAASATLPPGAGLAALLGHPTALADQLRAILDAGRGARLAILIPMVHEPAEISAVREVLVRVAADLGVPVPPVGIMVELAATAARAPEFARAAGFFSIGTNDLTGDVLGLSRTDPAAAPALAADPRVLALVQGVTDAATAAGIEVSVCGDAAADRHVLPLLLAAGIRSVSVAAGAVGRVRAQIQTARAS